MTMSEPSIQTVPTTRPHEQAQQTQQHPQLALTPGETRAGGGEQCLPPSPGYLTVRSATSPVLPLGPQRFSSGFNKQGVLIGANSEVPYPSADPKYHHINFPRGPEWASTKPEELCKPEDKTKRPDVAEYFTAGNDDGYNQWVARKDEEEKNCDAQASLKVAPPEVTSLPAHSGPVLTETTNQMYGQYLDLRPKPPAEYPLPAKREPVPLRVLIKYRKSNVSDHPPIPDHAFAVDPREMVSRDGRYLRGIHGAVHYPIDGPGHPRPPPYTFRRSAVSLGRVVGERQAGMTWPIFSNTGLEINRAPDRRCVSVLTRSDPQGMSARGNVPARALPRVYSRLCSSAHPSHLGADPECRPNPMVKTHKVLCAPHTVLTSTAPHLNPCHNSFVNVQTLPIPLEIRRPPTC